MRAMINRIFVTALAAIVVTSALAAISGPASAAVDPAFSVRRIGGPLSFSVNNGDLGGVSSDGRYVVTDGGTNTAFTWTDTLTSATQPVGHLDPAQQYVGASYLQYLYGQSPSLAEQVQVSSRISGTGIDSMFTDVIGGATAVPSGHAWQQRIIDDMADRGCHPPNPPEILDSATTAVLVRVYGCSLDARDVDNGRTDTYLWRPSDHSFELVSVAPPPLDPSAGFSAFGSISNDGRYVVYLSAEDNPANPGSSPYRNGWYLYDTQTQTRTRIPVDDWNTAQPKLIELTTGVRLALIGPSGNLTWIDPQTMAMTPLILPPLPAHLPPYADPGVLGVFSPNGRYYLASVYSTSQPCCTQRSSLVLFDLTADQSTEITSSGDLAWGADLAPITVNDNGDRMLIQTGQTLTVGDGSGLSTVRSTYLITGVAHDTQPPVVTGTAAPAPNASGWNNSDVTVAWTAVDDTDGPLPAPPTVTLTSEGAAQTATSVPVCDAAGNCTTGTVAGINTDKTPPQASITGVTNGSVYEVGDVPTPRCEIADALSGPKTCSIAVAGGSADGTGAFTVTATATDVAGNTGSTSISYVVNRPARYIWHGFEPPVNDTAHQTGIDVSVFKAGSTVPVKFTLYDQNGNVMQPATPPRWLVPAQGSSTSAPVNETVYSPPASSGTTCQPTSSGGWQYNWKTDKAQAGYYWRIGVSLDDGTIYAVSIALR